MGIGLKWDITYQCFLKCKHCSRGGFPHADKDKELSLNEIRKVIPKLTSGRVTSIHLLGGEPTARTDLNEILSELMASGIRVGFNTNGIRFDAGLLRKLMESGMFNNLVFSLDGHAPAENDAIRGRGVFAVAVRNIRRATEMKRELGSTCTITINMVVGKHNYRSIPQAIDLALDLGVDELSLLQLVEEGNAKGLGLGITTEEHIFAVQDLARKYTRDNDAITKSNLRITPRFTRPLARTYLKAVLGLDFPEYVHVCQASKTFGYISPGGQLFPCDRLSPESLLAERIGINDSKDYSLLESDFYEIWDKPIFHDTFKLIESDTTFTHYDPCFRCQHLKQECTPCPAYALLTETRVIEHPCIYMLNALENPSSEVE